MGGNNVKKDKAIAIHKQLSQVKKETTSNKGSVNLAETMKKQLSKEHDREPSPGKD